MTLPLIAITGFKHSGKDTVGAFLVLRYGYIRAAFADELKIQAAMALSGEDHPHHPRTQYILAYFEEHKNDEPSTPCAWVRPYLQTFGEAKRDLFGANYWLLFAPLESGYVITDCRMPNEDEKVHAAGGVLWRVTRPGCASDGHASERHIPELHADVDVANDGTVEDLHRKVMLLMEALVP